MKVTEWLAANQEKLFELLGPDASGLQETFNLLGWANEEIDAAKDRHPKAVEKLDWAMMLLLPAPDKRMRVEMVYRAHCQELLDRVAEGGDTELGTDAEMLVAFSEASLMAPLNKTAMGVLNRIWRRSFPELLDSVGGTDFYESSIPTLVNEAEREIRWRMRSKGRKFR